QHHDVVGAIEPPPPGPFHRSDEVELRLPEPQHMLGGADFLGRFRNGAEGFGAFGQWSQVSTTASCTRLFMIWEARKLMTRRGLMAAGSPVLGLRPMRARFSRTWKTPNPDSLTVSPCSRASTIRSRVRSTSPEHSCRDSPTSSWTASHKSARVRV